MFKCGTDIVKISRIEKIIENKPEFINKIYSEDEIEYCNVANKQQASIHFAGRFAAKEAIYKALSGTNLKVSTWKDIEIISGDKNYTKPYVRINGEIIKKIDVSISHEKEFAIAMAIYQE